MRVRRIMPPVGTKIIPLEEGHCGTDTVTYSGISASGLFKCGDWYYNIESEGRTFRFVDFQSVRVSTTLETFEKSLAVGV